MIKQKVKYIEFVNNQEIETEKDIRLLFTIKTLKLYEETTGKNFFTDLQEATKELNKLALASSKNNNQIDEAAALAAITSSNYSEFLLNAIPALYIEIKDDKIIQNEQTFEKASESIWLLELATLEFLYKIFEEVNKFNKIKK